MEEYVQLVRQVLCKLWNAHLYVTLSKSEFHKTTLDYLGFWISPKDREMEPTKVKAVLDWQGSKT